MRHSDVERIAVIEQASLSPWQVLSLTQELERPHGIQLVATDDKDTILGWCCGLCMEAEAELFKIAVSQNYRRLGIGAALLLQFEDLCRAQGCKSLFLEVRAANSGAIGLYEKLKYNKIGCRKGYYTAPQDDALILRKSLLLQT